METIGDRLKKLRLARKLTQTQVAKAVGVRQGSYTQLERGLSKTPRSSNLAKYARLYDVDPEWLMTGKGPQHAVSILTDQESELILLFRSLSSESRLYVLGRARSVHQDEHSNSHPKRRASDHAPPEQPDSPNKSDH
jgi:transcriptional regulator with XRE-family HTH domain